LVLSGGISQGKEPKQNKNLEVTVEVKFVAVDCAVVEELKQQGLLEQESKQQAAPLLDQDQVSRFLEVVQKDLRSSVMQTPKWTVRNGQRGTINILDKKSFRTARTVFAREGQTISETKSEVVPLGLRMHIHPMVSADRRSIRLHFGLKWNDLVSTEVREFPAPTPAARDDQDGDNTVQTVQYSVQQPQLNKIKLSRTLSIPDGKTAVLTGSTRFQECEAHTVNEVPFLCDLPYVGRLFRTVAYECRDHQLLVLVTPSICLPPEKEERLPGQDENR
jgi:type II secretory pathway component GspD/PulD (secretin)